MFIIFELVNLKIILKFLRFISPKFPDKCEGCFKGPNEDFHNSSKVGKKVWTSEACTYEKKTEYYGELIFPGSKTKTAKVEIS